MTTVSKVCPRCHARLWCDYEDIFCLLCGWRQDGINMPRREFEKEYRILKEVEDGMNGFHITQHFIGRTRKLLA